jgi:NAD dependent epimerase/dehydratase family enzyme
MPWIAIDDLLYALDFCLENESIFGPVNFVAPEQTPNKAFAEALGKALQRPAIVRTPSFVLRAAFGEMAGETILADLPARPARLLDAGFDFRFPGVEAALLHLFGRC